MVRKFEMMKRGISDYWRLFELESQNSKPVFSIFLEMTEQASYADKCDLSLSRTNDLKTEFVR